MLRRTLVEGLARHMSNKKAARVREREIKAKLALTWKRHSMGLAAKSLSALKAHSLVTLTH